MASFPASVKSFTTKNSGDVIQAAHVNDAQDEINAIEGGYLNGTAHLNSSNSTLAALSVTGTSTLTGAVSFGAGVASTISFASSVSFAVRPIEPPPHFALVFNASTQAVGSSAASTLTFNSDAILTNSSMHSTAANPDRLVPQSTGLYRVAAQWATDGAPTGGSSNSHLRITILDSSVNFIAAQETYVSSNTAIVQCAGYKRFDALGGYAVVRFQNLQGGSSFSISSGVELTWFAMEKL